MSKSLDFYFDFISPYSFIAYKEIQKFEKKYSFKIKYRPILLGGLHNLHGIKAPAFIPSKARFMIRDCKIVSEKKNIKFKFNSYFPIKTLNLMRGVLIAEEDDIKNHYVDSIFNSIWRDGFNMNDQIVIEKVLKNININPKTFFLRLSTQTAKDNLKKKQMKLSKKEFLELRHFLLIIKFFGVKIDWYLLWKSC